MGITDLLAEPRGYLALGRSHRTGWEAEQVECPRSRVGDGRQRGVRAAEERADERLAQRAAPPIRTAQRRGDDAAGCCVKPFERVDGSKYLLERRALAVELEAELVANADERVHRPRQAVTVHLEAVAESRLCDPIATLYLAEQPVYIGRKIVVDLGGVCSDYCAEQQAADTRCRICRQHQMTERHTPRGCDRSGVPHFELGQQHATDAIGAIGQAVRRMTSLATSPRRS